MIISPADRLKGVKAYYFVQKLEQIRQMKAEGKDVINFGIGSPDLKPDKKVVDSLVATARADGNHGYQPYKCIPELREGISNWYDSTYSVSLDPNTEILPLMGSKEGILHVTLAFVNPGDEVLVPNPGYPTYTSLTKILGGSVKYYDLKEENGWYPDFDELEKADLSKVKLMWLNYPHMPTGTKAKKEVFQQYVDFAKRKGILLCHDNPYSLVLNSENPQSIFDIAGAKEVALEFNSLSKSHNMAGWRIGMLTGAKDYIDLALRVKSNIDSGMFLGLQNAAVEALSLEEGWHSERNEVYASRRKIVWAILDKLGCTYDKDQEGLFVWAKVPLGTDVERLIDITLEEKNIFFTPGFIFGTNGAGYIRFSLCVNEEDAKRALERL